MIGYSEKGRREDARRQVDVSPQRKNAHQNNLDYPGRGTNRSELRDLVKLLRHGS